MGMGMGIAVAQAAGSRAENGRNSLPPQMLSRPSESFLRTASPLARNAWWKESEQDLDCPAGREGGRAGTSFLLLVGVQRACHEQKTKHALLSTANSGAAISTADLQGGKNQQQNRPGEINWAQEWGKGEERWWEGNSREQRFPPTPGGPSGLSPRRPPENLYREMPGTGNLLHTKLE